VTVWAPFKKLGRSRRRLVLASAVGLAGTGLAAGRGGSDLPDPIVVRRDDLVLSVEVEGELLAVRSAEISPPPSREWQLKIALLAPEGKVVKKGEPVLAFDTQTVDRQLAEARAELSETEQKIERAEVDLRLKTLDLDQRIAQAEADLGKAKLKLEVPEDLQARNELQKVALDRAGRQQDLGNYRAERTSTLSRVRSELRSLHLRRERASRRVAELEAAIERMTVRAPLDAIVLHKTNWRDEKKKIGDSVGPWETVLSLPDLSELQGEGLVDEADGARVAVGQPVTLRLEARPELDIRGRVASIGRTVRRKSWRVPAKVYKLQVALERTDPTFMRPAMRFRGEVETGRLPGRLLVPREAVFMRNGGPVVFAQGFWGFSAVPVQLGTSSRRHVEVREGLREGDRILPVVPEARDASRPREPALGAAP
jgi:HlyD family secretion protein